MAADFGNLGLTVVSINQDFTSFTVPAGGSANSGTINGTLAAGAVSAIQLILLQSVDLINSQLTVS